MRNPSNLRRMFRVHKKMFRVPGTRKTRANSGMFRVFRVFRVYAPVRVYANASRTRTLNSLTRVRRRYTRNTRNNSILVRLPAVPGTRNMKSVPGTLP